MLRTPNLQLPQWETNDIISYLGEWNSAMDKIDDGFGTVQAVANSAQSTASTASNNATSALNLANDLADDVSALQSTVTTHGNIINTHTTQIGTLNTNVGGITAKVGTTDISDMGDGTITGALQSLVGGESVVLWTNLNPEIEFAGKIVSLSGSLSDYESYEIVYAFQASATSSVFSTGKIPVGRTTDLLYSSSGIVWRPITSIGNNSLTFSDGYINPLNGSGNSIDNTLLVPLKIIGIK